MGELNIRRFRVVEVSMLPTLRPGDMLLARADTAPEPGSIVVFPDPRAGRWLVKRVAAVSDGEAWVESDNADATRADSRTLGWVKTDHMCRAILRYRFPVGLRVLRPRERAGWLRLPRRG
ncbi:MAG TPA: S26 family signal peptidase [Acidimicrobiia bacterium]|nr:S26 family signal peptidase [Acidimicrobiia bacterium]